MRKYLSCVVCVWLVCFLLPGIVVSADGEASKGLRGASIEYTYRFQTANAPLQETLRTVMTPTPEGLYQVVTTVTSVSNPDEVTAGFFGASLQWLGLYMGDGGDSGQLNLSGLMALATIDLVPEQSYLLPDNAGLQTTKMVEIAGVLGVEGIYTPPSSSQATITVVLASDPWVRQLLPFPLRVHVEFPQGVANPIDAIGAVPFSGTIELTNYTYSQG